MSTFASLFTGGVMREPGSWAEWSPSGVRSVALVVGIWGASLAWILIASGGDLEGARVALVEVLRVVVLLGAAVREVAWGGGWRGLLRGWVFWVVFGSVAQSWGEWSWGEWSWGLVVVWIVRLRVVRR